MDKKEKNKVNLMTSSKADDRYGKFPTILLVFQSPSWWVDRGAIFMCVLISLYFLLIRASKVPAS